jgi:hypothetical protein
MRLPNPRWYELFEGGFEVFDKFLGESFQRLERF